MERKAESLPPTGAVLPAPIQESQGAESGSTTVPTIVLPQEDPPSSSSATPVSADPLMSNTDFIALKQFVDGRKSAMEGHELELTDETLVQ